MPIKLHSQLHSILDKKERKMGKTSQSTKIFSSSISSMNFSETRQAKLDNKQRDFYPSVIISLVSRTFRVLKACTICFDNLPIKGKDSFEVRSSARQIVSWLENQLPEKHTYLLQKNANLQ